ncbi:TonB-dependent siderophore receptor [Olivibacter sp. SDN3]|uniref:TonB-dependent siderophore receptor n=1 Tax=Olivibacter sp. SDN3 TaxID=2764720 RepID=UPI0016515428|nr:TonB-dependent siderophore receptor [Olivibacter sp. SDN3]QNL49872.1 TonB-dependent siderophore receptor [Olivibacter sp. SDN3]
MNIRYISTVLLLTALPVCLLFAQTIDTSATTNLDEVTINALHKKYNIDSVTDLTRAATKLLETPQSIQVISQQAIRDRQAFTLNEIAPLMTGVKTNNGMGSFSMRGFTSYYPFDASFLTFNGIRGNLYLWSQQPLLYNIEQVEVLRGPASALFSEGAPGGIINFTTKKPKAEEQFEFTASYGSWNMMRLAADATGSLTANKKLLYRTIIGYDRSNSFRDYQEVSNLLVAPSLAYHFDKRSALLLEVNYAYAKTVQQYDRGTYVYTRPDGTFDFNYYPNNLTVQSPSDYGKTHNTSVALNFDHQINEDLKLTFVQRYVRSRFDYADHITSGLITNDTIQRGYQDWLYDQYNWQTTAYLNYAIKTGSIQHQVLTGIDYNNYGWLKNDYRFSQARPIHILYPDYRQDPPPGDPSTDYYDDNKQVINLIGAYAQDQISYRHIKLLLSLRYDSYKLLRTPLSDRDSEQGNESDASAWIPRIGLVYTLQNNIAFYGSYTKSFNPQTSNSVRDGGPFPPRTATQYETGVKGSWFNDHLSAMVAAYTIYYNNILAPSPTPDNPNKQVAIDGTSSKGLEATLQGRIKNFSMVLGYALNNHVLRTDNSLGTAGSRFNNAPKHIGNLWFKYELNQGKLTGLGFGIGGRYMSNQVGFLAAQDFLIPASTVLDASLSYARKRWNLQFNMYNMTNARYFNGGNSRTVTASLGDPLHVRVGLGYLIR